MELGGIGRGLASDRWIGKAIAETAGEPGGRAFHLQELGPGLTLKQEVGHAEVGDASADEATS